MSETEAEKRGQAWCLCDEQQIKYANYDSMCRHEEMVELHATIRRLQAEIESSGLARKSLLAEINEFYERLNEATVEIERLQARVEELEKETTEQRREIYSLVQLVGGNE